jgi:hypothetical protein
VSKLESNLGPLTPEHRPKSWYTAQNKARRASKIVFQMLPVAREVASLSLVGPANCHSGVGQRFPALSTSRAESPGQGISRPGA